MSEEVTGRATARRMTLSVATNGGTRFCRFVRRMESTRIAGGAQIQVLQAADATTVRVTVRICREPVASQRTGPFDIDDAVFDWAKTNLGADVVAMLETRLKMFPLGVEEQVSIDLETGDPVLCWDSAKLLNMRLDASPEDIPELLCAPRVSDVELTNVRPEAMSSPCGAPTIGSDDSLPLRTAQRVAYLKLELVAKGHVRSRSVRTVACEMVARESSRTWEAVSASERRGRKHPRFSEDDLPAAAQDPLGC
jgi:hypothetical protein